MKIFNLKFNKALWLLFFLSSISCNSNEFIPFENLQLSVEKYEVLDSIYF